MEILSLSACFQMPDFWFTVLAVFCVRLVCRDEEKMRFVGLNAHNRKKIRKFASHCTTMEKTNSKPDKTSQVVIRVAAHHLSFSIADPQTKEKMVYEKYDLNEGIAIAANLREAFRHSTLLRSKCKRALLLIDSSVMLVPVDEFREQGAETLYKHTFRLSRSSDVVKTMLPDLNAMAVFSVNKDLRLVAEDNFEEVGIRPLMQPVWSRLYHRAFVGTRRKLFVYFHDKQLEVFCFQQNRFRFSNVYEATRLNNILYYILYVWKELGMNTACDELLLLGNIPNREQLDEELRKFLQRCYVIDDETDFANASISKRKDIPYDLKALYLE